MRLGPIGIGIPELLIILAVVLLIFGPKNLPKLGSAIGRTVKNLREGMGSSKKKEIEDAADAEVHAEDEVIVSEETAEEHAAPAAAESEPAKKTVKRVVKKKA